MFEVKNLRLWLTGVAVMALAATALSAAAADKEKARPNLLPNPGFEEDNNRDGRPDRWSCQPDGAEPEGAVALDSTERHGGKYSVRIRNRQDSSYSKILVSIPESKPDTDYVASCWIKVDEVVTLHQRLSPGAKLFIGDEKGNTLTASKRILKTPAGKWQRVVVPFNTRQRRMGSFILYLCQGKGTVWFDDVELVEGTEPIESSPEPEPEPTRFPSVAHNPVTVNYENTFYLIRGEVLPLSFHYKKTQPETVNLKLAIDFPQGVVLHTIFDPDGHAAGKPAGKAVRRDGKDYTRHMLAIPPVCLTDRFTPHRFHALIVEATEQRQEGKGTIYWHLQDEQGEGKEHQMTLITLPALPPVDPRPRRFRIIPCYCGPWGKCPVDSEYDRLFERMLDGYIKSGISGCFVPVHAVTRENGRWERMQKRPWINGGMAGWHPDVARIVMSEEELEEAQAVDENGEKYSKTDPCPTYCHQHNALGKMAERYIGYLTGAYRPGYIDPASFKQTDFYSLDYEPNRPGWTYCYCSRCLEAFCEHSGVPLEGLTPQKIRGQHGEKWIDFRGWQSVQMVGQFAKAIKEANPKLQFAYCSASVYPKLIDPIADFHCPMIYGSHPVQLFEYVNKRAGEVGKPFLPLIDLGLYFDPLAHWVSPEQLKIKILLSAAAGGQGIMFWHGLPQLGGLHFVKIRECSDIIAGLEEYYFEGVRADGLATVGHVAGGDIYRSTVHALGPKRLLSIFNFCSREATTVVVKFARVPPGKYSVYGPIQKETFVTPAEGNPVWREEDLEAGFTLDIGPLEATYMVLKPYGPAGRAQRTLRPGKPVKIAELPGTDVVEIPKVSEPPVIDGVLGDTAWKRAPIIGNFTVAQLPAKEQTSARLLYDADNLHVGVECRESKIEGLVTAHSKRDSAVYHDDCIEIFLRLGEKETRYYHFIVNSQGALYDARGPLDRVVENDTWNAANIKVGTSVKEKVWIVELSIPFADLGLSCPREGDVWGLNVCREKKTGGAYGRENSSWLPVFGAFIPPKLGQLVFK